MDWAEIVKFFAALFAIMNPVGNIPVFLSVTAGDATAARRPTIALAAATGVAVILISCIFAGAALLEAFGISVAALRTAGGLIVLSIAFSLLHAKASGIHHTPADAAAGAPENPALYPLAMPLMAGPGAISTVIVFAHGARGPGAYVAMVGVVLVMAALLYLGMRLAVPASRLIGEGGMNVITRLMGILLAAIAVEMVFAGARVLLKG